MFPCDIRLGHDTEECHMRERTEFLNAYLILENVFCGCSGSDKCYMHFFGGGGFVLLDCFFPKMLDNFSFLG